MFLKHEPIMSLWPGSGRFIRRHYRKLMRPWNRRWLCCSRCRWKLPCVAANGYGSAYDCTRCKIFYWVSTIGVWSYEWWWEIPGNPFYAPQRFTHEKGESPQSASPRRRVTVKAVGRPRIPSTICKVLTVAALVDAGVFLEDDCTTGHEIEITEPLKSRGCMPDWDLPSLVPIRATKCDNGAVLAFDGAQVLATAKPHVNPASRWWSLACPQCRRACRNLYKPAFPGMPWACNRCWRIRYPSQMTKRKNELEECRKWLERQSRTRKAHA